MTKEAIAAYNRSYREKNRERLIANQRKKYRENIEELRAKSRVRVAAYYAKNKDLIHERYRENIEAQRIRKAAWWKSEAGMKWKAGNVAKSNATKKDHQMRKLKAMPRWVNPKDIATFYEEARRRAVATGIEHDVDHIWPLKGSGFSGLHVPWNLQVLTATENRSKKNRAPL